MNYELAKRLKDAGFPQTKSQYGEYYITGSPGTFLGLIPRNDDILTFPTLEELIEACGDNLMSIDNIDSRVSMWRSVTPFPHKAFFGTSPIEAVAGLWLAINKKPS